MARSRVDQLELTGLAVDLPPYRYPPTVWTRAINVTMSEGFPRRARGYGRVFGTPLHVPKWLVNPRRGGVASWVYGGDTELAQVTAGVHASIKGTLVFDNSSIPNAWTGGVINGRSIHNPAGGNPSYWLPATPAALILPDWPTNRTARAMRVYREFLIAMNITEAGVTDEDLVRWSDAAPPNDVPQSWTASSQSLAGSASASFTPGPVVDGLTLRDQFMIYKSHAMYVLRLVGGQFVMDQRPVFSTLGALSQNCVVEWRGSHIVLADGDVALHNGTEAQSLVDRRVRRTIFDEIETSAFQTSFVALDKEKAEVWICIPEKGASFPTIAAVWSIRDNEWGIRDLVKPGGVAHINEGLIETSLPEPTWAERTSTWATDTTNWNSGGISPVNEKLLMADQATLLQGVDALSSFDGTPPEAELERTGLDFGLPDVNKYIRRIWPKVDGTSGSKMEVRVGAAPSANAPYTWGPWVEFTVDSGGEESISIPYDVQGRYIGVAFRSNSNAEWRSPSFDIEWQAAGRF